MSAPTFHARILREWYFEVDPEKCKRCGRCILACPNDVLGREDNGLPCMLSLNNCVGCTLCEGACPHPGACRMLAYLHTDA